MLAEAAAGLEAGGAELLILATNTMHKVPPLPAPAAHGRIIWEQPCPLAAA